MTELDASGAGDAQEELAQIRREFADGLTQRAATLRSSLDTLRRGPDPAAIETFFLTAHSLKGTAGAFGAELLAEHSAKLAQIGQRWRAGADVTGHDLDASADYLGELTDAIGEYQRGERESAERGE